jgi:hypothetical protein
MRSALCICFVCVCVCSALYVLHMCTVCGRLSLSLSLSILQDFVPLRVDVCHVAVSERVCVLSSGSVSWLSNPSPCLLIPDTPPPDPSSS